jgi:hypothetical protein
MPEYACVDAYAHDCDRQTRSVQVHVAVAVKVHVNVNVYVCVPRSCLDRRAGSSGRTSGERH